MKRRAFQAACMLSILGAVALLAWDREAAKPVAPEAPKPIDRFGEYAKPAEPREEEMIEEAAVAIEEEEVLAPSLPTLQEEIAENPHATPPSLVQFASALAPKLGQAMADADSAADLFPVLEDCARASERGRTVQAFCLANASELAGIHPGLEARFRALYDKADPRVIELMELTGM